MAATTNAVAEGQAHAEPGADAHAAVALESKKRPLILAVEDEAAHWEIYGKMLWYNGYDVARACDGEEGLQLAATLQPDLIVLDIMLPKLDGLELCRRLKESPATAHIPIVALSGRPSSELGPRAYHLGCVSYLEKPIGPVSVLHEIERLIGRAPLPGAA